MLPSKRQKGGDGGDAQGGSAGDARAEGAVRLAALRAEMARLGLDAVLVPSDDPHQSEYVATCYERRAFISGFKGSSGTAVVTATQALLWTDGRYFLQAEQQLFDSWALVKDRLPDTVSIEAWLVQCESVTVVGLDPLLASAASVAELRKSLEGAGKVLKALPNNPVDLVWGSSRPPPPSAAAFCLDARYAGQTVAQKLAAVKKALAVAKADVLVVAALDEVAWLLNVRGADIAFCPVSYAYATVSVGEGEGGRLQVCWFIDKSKVSESVLATVRESAGAGVDFELKEYADIEAEIRAERYAGRTVLVPSSASAALHALVTARQLRTQASPLAMMKALKNESEIGGMREAHVRDARALIKFLAWLERTDGGALETGAEFKRVDECGAATVLETYRKAEEGYVGPSFETISSYGPNGAVIHYSPEPLTCASLGADNLYLLDSGGQYTCGTTDVTRTVHLRPLEATAHMRKCWTRVLQAHIAVDSVVFPTGTTGYQLDAIARAPLWRWGLDYQHGTGHGVGHFLNVHEGPHGMSLTRISTNETALQPGMTLSNEPGYYEDGNFGIRIENVCVVKAVTTEHCFGGKQYLGFEHLTIVPFQRQLLEVGLLATHELAWLNAYHAECLQKLSGMLDGTDLVWLQQACAPIASHS